MDMTANLRGWLIGAAAFALTLVFLEDVRQVVFYPARLTIRLLFG